MKRYLYILGRLFLGFILIPLIIYLALYEHGKRIAVTARRNYAFCEPFWPFGKEDYGTIVISFLIYVIAILIILL